MPIAVGISPNAMKDDAVLLSLHALNLHSSVLHNGDNHEGFSGDKSTSAEVTLPRGGRS